MTVSPNQPPTGSTPGARRPSGVRVDTSHTVDPLPPTLFALPNLHPQSAAKTPQSTSATSHSEPSIDEPRRNESAGATPPTAAPANLLATEGFAPEMIIRHDPPVTEARTAASESHEELHPVEDPAEIQEPPTESSLLDRIGSHAIVLVMLLIVFGIALVAGRKPVIDSTDPLATQPADADSIVVESGTVVPETTGPVLAVDTNTVEPGFETTPYPTGVPGGVAAATSESSGMFQGTPVATSASTVSSRSVSAPTSGAPSDAAAENPLAEALRTEVSQVAKPPVDNEIPFGASPDAGPDPESLTPAASDSAEQGSAQPIQHRYSKTPRKIPDWSRYFLDNDTSYVVPTSATSPITQP